MTTNTGVKGAHVLLGIAILAVCSGCASGRAIRLDQSAAKVSAVDAIRRLTTVEWAEAGSQGNTAWFERHLADELRLTTGRTGKVTGKAEEIASVRRSTGSGGGEKIDDLQIQVYGDVAVTTFAIDTTGADEAGPYHRLARYTEVWVFRDGRWQLAASHSSLLPK